MSTPDVKAQINLRDLRIAGEQLLRAPPNFGGVQVKLHCTLRAAITRFEPLRFRPARLLLGWELKDVRKFPGGSSHLKPAVSPAVWRISSCTFLRVRAVWNIQQLWSFSWVLYVFGGFGEW